jgi:formylglycine-generating enzyme required for sulfatase activity
MSDKKNPKKKIHGRSKSERDEEQLPGQIVTSGGAFVQGNVSTGGGDFIGRDMKVQAGEGGVAVAGGVTESMIVTGSGNVLRDYDIRINNATIRLAADHFLASLGKEEPSPDLRDATQRYFDYLVARHRYLDMRGLAVHDRLALRLPLLNLYVPLIARLETPRGDTWERQAILAGRKPAGQGEAEMRMGGLQPVLDLLQKQAGLVVLGDPGSGKTTFLKYLALRLGAGEGRALGLGERLPILVPVSAYANALDRQGGLRLDDFISRYFHDIGADLPVADMLRKALQEGNALILLDGLDEVGSQSLRRRVVQRIADFCAFHKGAGNKFVLTSRIIGYREVRLEVEDLVECVLADFTDEQIQAFLEHWSLVLEKQVHGDSEVARRNAERERQTLWAAIQRNAGVRALAANPLLLTILALIKRQGVILPERRVELYDLSLRTLLSTWNRARSLGEEDLPGRDLDERQTIRLLAPLALWMHQVNPGVGLVNRPDLEGRLEALFRERGDEGPQEAAVRFMRDVHDYTGLLLERGPGMYGFIHLTFEEYLAAIAIAQKGQLNWKVVLDEITTRIGDPAWREVLLLTIGYIGLIKLDDQVAGNLLEALVNEQPGEPGEAVLFAGDAVLDTRPRGVPPKVQRVTMQALVAAMQDVNTPPPLRRRAGLTLGSLGWSPDDLDEFVEIPPGKFRMGSTDKDPQAYDDEKPQRVVEIPQRFWIGKYPVTNRQFARFVEGSGYQEQAYWSKDGWRWREEGGRTRPQYWEDHERANPLFPVVGVTWFEAEAYCRWLNSQELPFSRPKGYRVRLPTEQEWEYAARGNDGRIYPWGDVFEARFANTGESDTNATTAVCTYPQGQSPFKVWDMSGNVWEWTASWWEKEKENRVLRGGSWFDLRRNARCASRDRCFPGYFSYNIGFRVVVSLAISDD